MASKTNRHPLLELLNIAARHRAQVKLGVGASIVNKLFDLAPPLLIGAAVDVVVAREASFLARFGITDISAQLWLLAALTLIIWTFESLTDYLATFVWRNIAQGIQHDLRISAFNHLQQMEMRYFEDRNTGDLMAVLNDDVNQLERFLDGGAHELIILITTVVAVGGLFIAVVPSVAWMAILPMPFIALGSLWFQKKIAPRYALVRGQAGALNAQLANTLGGIATVKSYTAERYESERLTAASEEYRSFNRKAIALSAAFVPLIRMIIVLGFTAIMVYGGKLAVAGELNVGAYSILVFMTQRLLWPITRLGTTLDLYQRAMASTARVLKVLSTTSTIASGSRSVDSTAVRGEVRFAGVSFSYIKGHRVIHDVDITVAPGETVGFVGATGSGKTTLVKLLLRFYDPDSGAIYLDGTDVRELDLHDLRRAIGLVSQDVFLIDGTVLDNIRYGTFDAGLEEVIAAARVAEAHDFITRLPHGYDTIVGERGQKLSGGQRQRISIARAVLKNPHVFVLDEATSSVDNETEAAIQRAMYRIAEDRTMLIIAHRLSTVRHADRIIVLDNGRVVEVGTHEELLAHDGIYASLWRVQTGELIAA